VVLSQASAPDSAINDAAVAAGTAKSVSGVVHERGIAILDVAVSTVGVHEPSIAVDFVKRIGPSVISLGGYIGGGSEPSVTVVAAVTETPVGQKLSAEQGNAA